MCTKCAHNVHRIYAQSCQICANYIRRGDILRPMITTRLYLDCRRSKPGRPAPLKLTINKDQVRTFLNLGIDIPPEFWDAKNQVAVKDYSHLNLLISQQHTFIKTLLFQWNMSGEIHSLSSTQIKDMLATKLYGEKMVAPDDSLQDSFYVRFHNFKDRHKGRTKEIYAHTAKRITAYLGENGFKNLDFEDITVKWLRDFDLFLAKTSPSRNARNIHFRNIRAVFNDALDDEVISCYPFRKFKIRPERTRKRAMLLDDIRKLFEMDVEPYAEIYRDMFKLSFFLIGINTVDLFGLKSITADGRLEYERAKTHRLYSIKVEPEALALIEKYRGKSGLLSIADRWVDSISFRHQLNKSLRLIGAPRSGLGGKKGEGMFPKISSYWARHTWATVAASLDIPKETISAALGHGGDTVTDIYIDFEQRKVDEANRRVLDWVLYDRK